MKTGRYILFVLTLMVLTTFGQNSENKTAQMETMQQSNETTPKMKVEIWSDVMCPFCYIGKRQYESALKEFADSNHVEIVWKSFQLDPSVPEVATLSHTDYLVQRKGMSVEQVNGALENVTQYAQQVGLEYDLYNAVTVNTMKAHQLIQFAKTKGLGDQMEERLFRAFFVESKNIADIATLTQLGTEVGLDEAELQVAFTDAYANLVKQDIQEAQQIGVTGVPFFVFDRKYAVSGAQPANVFLKTLEKSFSEWREKNPEIALEIIQGKVCTPDGKCD